MLAETISIIPIEQQEVLSKPYPKKLWNALVLRNSITNMVYNSLESGQMTPEQFRSMFGK